MDKRLTQEETHAKTKELALARLCWYDKRNPDYTEDEDWPIERKDTCYCDNCFYGRDKLANIILNLLEELKNYDDSRRS